MVERNGFNIVNELPIYRFVANCHTCGDYHNLFRAYINRKSKAGVLWLVCECCGEVYELKKKRKLKG